jgi:hypothetical protein
MIGKLEAENKRHIGKYSIVTIILLVVNVFNATRPHNPEYHNLNIYSRFSMLCPCDHQVVCLDENLEEVDSRKH